MSLNKFLLYFFAFTAVLVSVSWLLKDVAGLEAYFIPKYWLIFGFMAGITVIVYLVSWLGIKNGGQGQVMMTLGGVVIRLIMSMFMVLFYLETFEVDPIIFIVNFFSVYFLFTVFEIYCLLVNLRHQIKK